MKDAHPKSLTPDVSSHQSVGSCEDKTPYNRTYLRILTATHWFFLICAYTYLLLKAVLEFSPHWDFLAYHLPGALERIAATTFTPNERIRAVLDGFPPLPHTLQGLLILLTGSTNAACAINFLGLTSSLIAIRLLFGENFSYRFYLSALLAVPLVVLHLNSGYIDLWSNTCLSIAFFALLPTVSKRSSLVFSMALIATALSKYQMWPLVLLLTCIGMWHFRSVIRQHPGAFVVLFLCLSAWPVRNVIVFSNPTYPVQPPLIAIKLPSVEHLGGLREQKKNTPQNIWSASRPERFLRSAFELNYLSQVLGYAEHTDVYRWTLDQAVNEFGARSPHHRMGGWFFATMALLFTLFAFALRRVPLVCSVPFVASIAIVSFIPQSHELRYYLFIPIALGGIVAYSYIHFSRTLRSLTMSAIFMLGAYVLFSVKYPFPIRPSTAKQLAPEVARAYWGKPTPGSCIVASYDTAIYFSGPTFNEYRVTHCD